MVGTRRQLEGRNLALKNDGDLCILRLRFWGLWRISFEHLSCFLVSGLFALRGYDLAMTSQMSRAVILAFGFDGFWCLWI